MRSRLTARMSVPQAPPGDYMRIMGIDPGLQITGYGLIDHADGRIRLIEGGVIRSDPHALLEARLEQIHSGIADVLAEYAPEAVAVEDLYSSYGHPRTAILMGHARGVIYLAAAQRGIRVVAYPPALVKRAVAGHGRAGKSQVAAMVCQLLHLDEPPKPVDITDALALAVCHTAALRGLIAPTSGRRPQLPERLLAKEERP